MTNKAFEFTNLHKEIITLIRSGYLPKNLVESLSIKQRDLVKELYRLLINGKQYLTPEDYQLLLNTYLASYYFKEFPTGEIAIISDTHLASKNENLEYLQQVKDFLKNNNIKYLLHGGDIGDGMVEYAKAYGTYLKQLEHILDTYDLGDGTKQFVLGGNHDAKYKRKNSTFDILTLLEENNPNITGVGYYQAYFKLGTNVISFEHNSYYKKSFDGRDLSILGHSHYLAYKASTVILPTLSDSFPNPQRVNEPGFIVLNHQVHNNHTKVEFTNYKTTEHGLEKGKVKSYILR